MKCKYCGRQEDHTHMFIIHNGVKIEDEDFDVKDGKLYHEGLCIGERDTFAGYWIYSKYEKDYQLVYERILGWKTKFKEFFRGIWYKAYLFTNWPQSKIYCTHEFICSDCEGISVIEGYRFKITSACCRNCAYTAIRKNNKNWKRYNIKIKL